jgi:hypothetical protein
MGLFTKKVRGIIVERKYQDIKDAFGGYTFFSIIDNNWNHFAYMLGDSPLKIGDKVEASLIRLEGKVRLDCILEEGNESDISCIKHPVYLKIKEFKVLN